MITSHSRGHKIIFDVMNWRYTDGTIYDDSRPCIKCEEQPTKKGYDACLGYIDSATSACCGHGVEEPFVMYKEDAE